MKAAQFDEHGQPVIRAFNAQRIADRDTDELLGMCHGLLADGVVNQLEAEYLRNWMAAREEVRSQWPGNLIHARLYEYLEDGVLDSDEKEELFEFMAQLTGHTDTPLPATTSTALPFDSPMPELTIDRTTFCLTGRFAFGSRKDCERLITSLGGLIHPRPLKKTECVLVVGFLGSTDWIHSSYGRKIEQAVSFRTEGRPIAIVSEDHWMQCCMTNLEELL